ncbi:MAG: histidine phosphatase family protein [Mogibacterium sp.]|nr:histidine phosphatase family protein [Mogibacterium sp.]
MNMIKVTIIRHGRTKENDERRYCGCRTDSSLTAEGKAELSVIPACEKAFLIASPLRRAIETAETMFPGPDIHIIDDLRETDFGKFEGKRHEELDGDPDYQAWIDSNGTAEIPGGESMQTFRARTMEGFREAVRMASSQDAEDLIIVGHGGTVMSVMSILFGGSYYDYYTLNGDGYTFELEVNDEGDIAAAGTYNRFCGRVHS